MAVIFVIDLLELCLFICNNFYIEIYAYTSKLTLSFCDTQNVCSLRMDSTSCLQVLLERTAVDQAAAMALDSHVADLV